MLIDFSDSLFFRNVRYLRKKAGLSLKKLGEQVGLSPVTLRQLEAGRIPPIITKTTLASLCRVFDIPMEVLAHTDLTGGD